MPLIYLVTSVSKVIGAKETGFDAHYSIYQVWDHNIGEVGRYLYRLDVSLGLILKARIGKSLSSWASILIPLKGVVFSHRN
jgi:hypothetical protein